MIFCNLREILKEKNITATSLAEQTGISRNTINQLVNNKTNGIQFDTLNKVCMHLGVKLNELLLYISEDISITNVEAHIKDNRLQGNVTIQTAHVLPITNKRPISFSTSLDIKIEFESNIIDFDNKKICSITYDVPNDNIDEYLYIQELYITNTPKLFSILTTFIDFALSENATVKEFISPYEHTTIGPADSFSPLFNDNEPVRPADMINALSLVMNRD